MIPHTMNTIPMNTPRTDTLPTNTRAAGTASAVPISIHTIPTNIPSTDTISAAPAHRNTGSPAAMPVAILLAGGLSTRMGCCKQLRPLCGKPLIRYIIDTLLESGLTRLVITVNTETRQPITDMIERLAQKQCVQNESLKEPAAGRDIFNPFHCDIVVNPEPERGQGHSAALAVQAAYTRYGDPAAQAAYTRYKEDAVQTVFARHHEESLAANSFHTAHITRSDSISGFLFCTADQPFLQADSIRDLCAVFCSSPDCIVSAAFNGTHCSPVIFPAALTDELSRLDGSIGGRTVMNAHPDLIRYSPLRSAMEAFDIDTPEDFTRAEEYVQRRMQRSLKHR